MLSLLSWAACLLLLFGLKLIGDKRIGGFYVAMGAEILWIGWGALSQAYAIVFMSLAICLMYVRAIAEWKKSQS